jgi:hypothetical protein
MAVAERLMGEFEGHSMTVLHVVAEAADDHPGCDPALVESAARARLVAFLGERCDSPAWQAGRRIDANASLPDQRAAS